MKSKILVSIAIGALLLGCGSNICLGEHEHSDEHSDLFKTVVVKDGTNLDIKECVALAFRNSPKIRRAKYDLDVAKSNLGVAKSAFFPVIGAGASFYNENNSNHTSYGRRYRELPNVGVTVNQLVWDFGKSTANIKMEEFYKIGAEYEFMDNLCSTLFDVKEKYYEVLKEQALVAIAQDNVRICEKYVRIAKNKADKATAKFYLSKAKFELFYTMTELKNAKVNLSNAMFVDNTPDYNILNTKTFAYDKDYGYVSQKIPPVFEPCALNFARKDAMEIAYSNSPDLKVLESTRNAMEQSLKYVKRTYFPELSANVGYGYLDTNEASSNNRLNVGVSLSSDINLMSLKHSIKGADAQLKLAENEIELFKKDLYFEVQKALNNIEFAQEDVPFAQNSATQALENINLVEKQYIDGTLNYTALQDARKDYINAIQSYIKSLHFYNKSLIQVEEAMHYHMVDIHHKTQHAMTKHSDELIEHLNEALNCDERENKKKKNKRTKHNL